jgi:hypothetical protein
MGVIFRCVLREGRDVREMDKRTDENGIVWILSLTLPHLHFHRYERSPFFNQMYMFASETCNLDLAHENNTRPSALIRSSSLARCFGFKQRPRFA